jgi:hypothetical protein
MCSRASTQDVPQSFTAFQTARAAQPAGHSRHTYAMQQQQHMRRLQHCTSAARSNALQCVKSAPWRQMCAGATLTASATSHNNNLPRDAAQDPRQQGTRPTTAACSATTNPLHQPIQGVCGLSVCVGHAIDRRPLPVILVRAGRGGAVSPCKCVPAQLQPTRLNQPTYRTVQINMNLLCKRKR